MQEYHKIETLYERDEKTKRLIEGKFRNPTLEYLKDNKFIFTEKVDGCLHSKTLICMADGTTKYIKDIKPGELVFGYDTKKLTPKIVEVKAVQCKPRAGEWVIVKTTRKGLNKGNSVGHINCTHDHKFWTKNRGYVEACELQSDDILLSIRNDIVLTPIQKQILIGKMLGDGTLHIKHNKYIDTASIEWGQKEKEYTEWCLQGLQELSGASGDRISGYERKIYFGKTKNTVSIHNEFIDWVSSGHKEVPNNVKLTPISIAFWYMDDGSLTHYVGQEDRVRFATNGFNKESCQHLVNELSKFDITATIKDYKGNTICLDAENAEKMFLLVFPYICESKKYKLPERYRDCTPYLPSTKCNQYHPMVVEQHVISIEKDPKSRKRWDIETETHNFFTVGGLVHNTNIRVHWDGHKVEFGGRTDKAQIPQALLDRLNQLFGGQVNEEMFEQKFGETEVFIFGEGYGPKIQNGGEYRDDVDFIIFDVQIAGNWQPRESVEDIANYFNCDIVPIVLEGTLQDAVDYVKTNRKSIVAKNGAEIEGVVGRPAIELKDRTGKRVIVKIKYCDFKE